MVFRKFKLLALLPLLIGAGVYEPQGALQPQQSAVFVGSTPCDKKIKPIKTMDTSFCEFAKWQLTLVDLPAGRGRFNLHVEYGETVPSTTLIKNGGSKIDLAGNWQEQKGSPQSRSMAVIKLEPEGKNPPIFFLKINDQQLHMLDENKQLMIGSPAWSYSLNKKN